MAPSSSSSSSGLGGIFPEVDLDEVQKEQEALRKEFDETMSQLLKDPDYFHKLVGDTSSFEEEEEHKKESVKAARDVLGDGRLMKRCLRSVSPRKLAEYGDEVTCRCDVRDERRTVLFESEACDFVVGSLHVPQMFSACALATALGETSQFEIHPSLGYEDDRFRDGWMPRQEKSGILRLEIEVKEIRRRTSRDVRDISGGLGPGHLVMKMPTTTEAATGERSATCDVVYLRSVFAPVITKHFGWPKLVDGEEDFVFSDSSFKTSERLEHKTRRVSRCELACLFDRDDDGRDENYVERLMVEAMMGSLNTELCFFLSKKAAEKFLEGTSHKGAHSLLVRARAVDFCAYRDCVPNRPGAVVKRTTRMGERGTRHPRDTDIVQVRGLVNVLAEDDERAEVVACAYGSDVASEDAKTTKTNVGATWRLDEEGSVRLFGNDALKGPLCAGIELAVRSMVVGEVAQVVVAAPDLGFVRPPPSAQPPKHARTTDIVAYHYASDDAAYRSLPEEAFSKPLRARLELVDRNPSIASLGDRRRTTPETTSGGDDDGKSSSILNDSRAPSSALADAQDLKARGARHFKNKAFNRAARRYSDALVCVGVGLEAVKIFNLTSKQPATKTASQVIAEESYPKPTSRTGGRKSKRSDDASSEKKAAAQDDDVKDEAIVVKEQEELLLDMETALRLNRAACDLKRCRYERCIEDCEIVLARKPKDLKATYRSGLAHMSLRDFEKARDCFETCLIIDHKCEDARKGLSTVGDLQKEQKPFTMPTTTAGGGFGNAANKRRSRDPKRGGPDDLPAKPLSQAEQYERDFLGDLDRHIPPWLRKKKGGEDQGRDDHNTRPSKRPLGGGGGGGEGGPSSSI